MLGCGLESGATEVGLVGAWLRRRGVTRACYPVLLGLTLISLVNLVTYALVYIHTETVEMSAEMLNRAGRQHMLSQRIIKSLLLPGVERRHYFGMHDSTHSRASDDALELASNHNMLKKYYEKRSPDLEAALRKLDTQLFEIMEYSIGGELAASELAPIVNVADGYSKGMEEVAKSIQTVGEYEHRVAELLLAFAALSSVVFVFFVGGKFIRPIVNKQRDQLLEEKALRLKCERLSLVARLTSNAVIITNSKGLIEWVNEGFERIAEYRMSEVVGRHPGAFLQTADTCAHTRERIRKAVEQGLPIRCEILNRSKSGREYWIDLDIQPIYESGELSGFIAIESDVTERRLLLGKARYDALTHLSNRGFFMEHLSGELARQGRGEAPFCLMMIDIDFFKRINDEHGHHVGDQALIQVAGVIASSIRQTDQAGRIGGEEFAVLLPNTVQDEAVVLAERLRHCIERERVIADDKVIYLTASVGLAQIESRLSEAEALKLADEALYEAKRCGRNRVVSQFCMRPVTGSYVDCKVLEAQF